MRFLEGLGARKGSAYSAVLGRMKQAFKFVLGFALALIFAASAVFSAGVTLRTVMDAVQSGGSLEKFEAHIRHYSDRLETSPDGIGLIRVSHPFVLHFGMLSLSWVGTVASAAGLRYLFLRREGYGRTTLPESRRT